MNIFLNLKLGFALLKMPDLAKKKAFLLANGVQDPVNFFGMKRDNTPWITTNTLGAAISVDFIPPNVTSAGPIVLSLSPAEEQDPELMKWVKRKPTLLINLGSAYRYSITHTKDIIAALEIVLAESNLQILWKYDPSIVTLEKFDWEAAVQPMVDTGRVKVERWLKVDPPSLLQSGCITAFVTHGGSNGYHDAIEYVCTDHDYVPSIYTTDSEY